MRFTTKRRKKKQYMKSNTSIKLPTPLLPEEEKLLTEEYVRTKSVKIRNILVEKNTRLVAKIVSKYPYNDDLFAEGCVGLIRGVENFDPSRGNKLSTYVSFWVEAYVLNYIIKDARLVKLGTTQAQRKLFFNLNKEKAKLSAQGLEITPELIAERLSVSEKDVVEMQSRLV